MAIGMNRETGKSIDGVDHLRQSVTDILTTRIGQRVMLRKYGSNLPELVDLPTNRARPSPQCARTSSTPWATGSHGSA